MPKIQPNPALQLRAENNIKSLEPAEEKHIRWVIELPIDDIRHAVGCMTPTTGCPSDKRKVRQLEVLYDWEKSNSHRTSVLKAIEAAFRKHSKHAEKFGTY